MSDEVCHERIKRGMEWYAGDNCGGRVSSVSGKRAAGNPSDVEVNRGSLL